METIGSTELFSMTTVCLSKPKSMANIQMKRAERSKSPQYADATNTECRTQKHRVRFSVQFRVLNKYCL